MEQEPNSLQTQQQNNTNFMQYAQNDQANQMNQLVSTGMVNKYNRFEYENEEDDDEQPLVRNQDKCSKCAQWVLCLLPLIFFLLALILLAIVLGVQQRQNYILQKESFKSMEFFNQILKETPIKDIKFIPASSECDSDWQRISIGFWSGIKSGCLCQGSKKVHSRAYCILNSDCKATFGYPIRKLYIWDNQQICVKKYDQNSWNFKKGKQCPTGMRQCQSLICIKSSEKCPVSKLSIHSQNERINENEESRKYTSNSIHKILKIHRSTLYQAIVSFSAIQSNQKPCINYFDKRPIKQDKSFYPLQKISESGCGAFGHLQQETIQLDQYSPDEFYSQNGLKYIINYLPFYKEYNSQINKLTLYSLSKPQIDSHEICQNLDIEKIRNLNKAIHHYNNEIKFFCIIGLILAIVGLIMWIIFLIKRKNTIFWGTYKGLLLIYALGIILCLILFIFGCYHWGVVNYYDVHDENKHYAKLLSHGCFIGTGFNEPANYIKSYIDDVFLLTGPTISFLFFWAIIFLIVFLVSLISRRIRKKTGLAPIIN